MHIGGIVMRVSVLVSVVLSLAVAALSSPTVRPSEPLPGDVTLTGAGATFPAPVYARWANDYKKKTGIKINYQAIGSGGGIAQIKNKTVDFGATDEPLSDENLDKAGLAQFPTVIGGVVVVLNMEGVATN